MVSISEVSTMKTASKINGGGGPSGTDAVALHHWLLRYGVSSRELRTQISKLIMWMANSFPPWAAYRGFTASRLIALDKGQMKGIRPIGIGEIWRRLFSKVIIRETSFEVQESCSTDQLCAGLSCGIEGSIHTARLNFEALEDEDEAGFLLVDASNAFNEENRRVILWVMRHEWPSAARFSFNIYRHWGQLIVRNQSKPSLIIFSKEGVTQGDPLSMYMFGLGTLPLILFLSSKLPTSLQLWYADDSSFIAGFNVIQDYFNLLKDVGPKIGYFPQESKCVLVVKESQYDRSREVFSENDFKFQTGSCFLGAFIGDKSLKNDWAFEKNDLWSNALVELSKVAIQFPQAAYVGIQKSLQDEWQFVQRTTPGLSNQFPPLEDVIESSFFPSLFDGMVCSRLLSQLPVKWGGLAIPIPHKVSDKKFQGFNGFIKTYYCCFEWL